MYETPKQSALVDNQHISSDPSKYQLAWQRRKEAATITKANLREKLQDPDEFIPYILEKAFPDGGFKKQRLLKILFSKREHVVSYKRICLFLWRRGELLTHISYELKLELVKEYIMDLRKILNKYYFEHIKILPYRMTLTFHDPLGCQLTLEKKF